MACHSHLPDFLHGLPPTVHSTLYLIIFGYTLLHLLSCEHSCGMQRTDLPERRLLSIVRSLLTINYRYMFNVHLTGFNRWDGLIVGLIAGVWTTHAHRAEFSLLILNFSVLLCNKLLSNHFNGFQAWTGVLLPDHSCTDFRLISRVLSWESVLKEDSKRVLNGSGFWRFGLDEMVHSFSLLLCECYFLAWTIIIQFLKRCCWRCVSYWWALVTISLLLSIGKWIQEMCYSSII